jgi:membrane associated rhomboid family serine protease
MWALWIFGATLEGGLGAASFLIFYLCCAVASTYAHGYFNPYSDSPMIGASGAIAGVVGAYAVLFPRARIALLVPVLIIPIIFRIRALAYAPIWFSIQLLLGIHFLRSEWNMTTPELGISIAWWAHIGGFIAGVVLVPFALLLPRPRIEAATVD